MSSPGTVSAEELEKMFSGVIDVLRYHVATGRFSYVDRIAAAMDSRVVEEALREALRAALSAASSPRTLRGSPVRYDESRRAYVPVEGETISVSCAEEEDLGRPGERELRSVPGRVWLHGVLVYAEGRFRACFTPPRLPSEDELARFMDLVSKDLEVAKRVASLSMTPPPSRR